MTEEENLFHGSLPLVPISHPHTYIYSMNKYNLPGRHESFAWAVAAWQPLQPPRCECFHTAADQSSNVSFAPPDDWTGLGSLPPGRRKFIFFNKSDTFLTGCHVFPFRYYVIVVFLDLCVMAEEGRGSLRDNARWLKSVSHSGLYQTCFQMVPLHNCTFFCLPCVYFYLSVWVFVCTFFSMSQWSACCTDDVWL